MRRFFAMMRYNKKLLIVSICLLVDVCLVLGLGVFDIIQLIQINSNSAMLSPAFIPINFILIALAVANIVALISFIIFKRRKEKSDDFEQD